MLEYIYQATGLLLIAFSIQTFADKANSKRIGTGAFWLIYGLTFCLGKVIPDWLFQRFNSSNQIHFNSTSSSFYSNDESEVVVS